MAPRMTLKPSELDNYNYNKQEKMKSNNRGVEIDINYVNDNSLPYQRNVAAYFGTDPQARKTETEHRKSPGLKHSKRLKKLQVLRRPFEKSKRSAEGSNEQYFKYFSESGGSGSDNLRTDHGQKHSVKGNFKNIYDFTSRISASMSANIPKSHSDFSNISKMNNINSIEDGNPYNSAPMFEFSNRSHGHVRDTITRHQDAIRKVGTPALPTRTKRSISALKRLVFNLFH